MGIIIQYRKVFSRAIFMSRKCLKIRNWLTKGNMAKKSTTQMFSALEKQFDEKYCRVLEPSTPADTLRRVLYSRKAEILVLFVKSKFSAIWRFVEDLTGRKVSRPVFYWVLRAWLRDMRYPTDKNQLLEVLHDEGIVWKGKKKPDLKPVIPLKDSGRDSNSIRPNRVSIHPDISASPAKPTVRMPGAVHSKPAKPASSVQPKPSESSSLDEIRRKILMPSAKEFIAQQFEEKR